MLSGSATVLLTPSIGLSAGFFSKAGDIRKIKFQNSNTGERVNTIYWIEGQYVQEALDEINYFMRDWRQNKVIKIASRARVTQRCCKSVFPPFRA